MEYVRAARKAREEEYGSGEEDDSEYEREEGSVVAAEEHAAETETADRDPRADPAGTGGGSCEAETQVDCVACS